MFLTAAGVNATEILNSAMTTVQTDMMSAIGTAAPVALGIGSAVLVIRWGWKLFRGLAK